MTRRRKRPKGRNNTPVIAKWGEECFDGKVCGVKLRASGRLDFSGHRGPALPLSEDDYLVWHLAMEERGVALDGPSCRENALAHWKDRRWRERGPRYVKGARNLAQVLENSRRSALEIEAASIPPDEARKQEREAEALAFFRRAIRKVHQAVDSEGNARQFYLKPSALSRWYRNVFCDPILRRHLVVDEYIILDAFVLKDRIKGGRRKYLLYMTEGTFYFRPNEPELMYGDGRLSVVPNESADDAPTLHATLQVSGRKP